ncbi:MAG: SAM-dependent methyltransferase, partial [Syntrophales bacterium]|nr:SAM-dependent methyltransferase [Syntrophales bacterium]
ALKAKISIVHIPGPSAVITALVVSGLPADSFLFLAFLPARVSERRKILTSLVEERRTIVLFESPHRLEATINDIYEILGDRPMALARELTKVHEEVIRGTTGEIREKLKGRHLKGEITLVIGGVREKKSVSDEEIINALLRLKGEEGMTDRDRIAQVAREKGISRRRVYLLDLKLRKSHPFS